MPMSPADILKDLERLGTLTGMRALDVSRETLAAHLEKRGRAIESTTSPQHEAIIRLYDRPVLFVVGDEIQEAENEALEAKLQAARPKLHPLLPSIGRLELKNSLEADWLGTAWMIDERILVTARHVARRFSSAGADGNIVVHTNALGEKIEAAVDTRQELGRTERRRVRIHRVLHIEEEDSLDLAFLEAWEMEDGEPLSLAPIPLAENDAVAGTEVAAIGYPGWDGLRNGIQNMTRIFGETFGIKRCHPGRVEKVEERYFTHDCSMLGGNSGSPIIDLQTGHAVGMHFAGGYRKANYAVKASALRERLSALKARL